VLARELCRETLTLADAELPILLAHHAVPLDWVAASQQREYRRVRIPLGLFVTAPGTYRHQRNACPVCHGSLSHVHPPSPKWKITPAHVRLGQAQRETAPALAAGTEYLSGTKSHDRGVAEQLEAWGMLSLARPAAQRFCALVLRSIAFQVLHLC